MKVTVWTKQHHSVLADLQQTGRYIPAKERIKKDMGGHDNLILLAYDWLVKQVPDHYKPADATYPVWVSPSREATMMPSPNTVIMELEIESEMLTYINISKWGAILNFSYLPLDESDSKRHREKLSLYGLSDSQVVMSRFYPELKQEIIASWSRLFDDSVSLGSVNYYAIIWEVKQEWIKQII